jgi:signal transduction histidine kinase
VVKSDGEMLWHVFSNLLGNAIKFSNNNGDGRIGISVKQEGGRAVVSMRDNGIGMNRDLAEKVFDPFMQSSASEEGIGVGLTLCRMIMEGLGGDVALASRGPGLGATATVTLPVSG